MIYKKHLYIYQTVKNNTKMEEIQNIRRLLDSGQKENIEMAIHLTANVDNELIWLHNYAKAKLKLMELQGGYFDLSSWYKIRLVCLYHGELSAVAFPIAKKTVKLNIYEINENAANELHYAVTALEIDWRKDLGDLLDRDQGRNNPILRFVHQLRTILNS